MPQSHFSEPVSDLTLHYRQHLPVPQRPRGGVLLLHGVGGNETSLAALANCLDPALAIALVRAPFLMAPGQFGWFTVQFHGDGPHIDPGQADASRLKLDQFIQEWQRRYGLKPEQTLIAGFSQGGIMSASLALTRPQRVAGFACLSGRILPEIETELAPPEALAHLQAFVAHGREDSKLPVAWALKADALLHRLQLEHGTHLYPADHEITPRMAEDFRDWVQDRLPPA